MANPMFQSATRVSLLSMVFTLCLIMLYTTALYASFGAETYKMIFLASIAAAPEPAPVVPAPVQPIDELIESLKQ